MTDRPTIVTLEPDQARDRAMNLIRRRMRFAVEIDPAMRAKHGGTMKDICVLSIGGVLIKREDTHDYADLTATDLDTACQFVWNAFAREASFGIEPTMYDTRQEWLCRIERPKRSDSLSGETLRRLRSHAGIG